MLSINVCLLGLTALIYTNVSAITITIEEMAEKNNRILELDQEIAIAEKSKKLSDLKNMMVQPETISLPKIGYAQRSENIFVLSVHGSPENPVVDVQYGDLMLQKRLGENLPDGWKMTAVGNNTVTFTQKSVKKPDVIRTIAIGHPATQALDDATVMPAPTHSIKGQ